MRRIADQLASGRENAVPREVMAAFSVSQRGCFAGWSPLNGWTARRSSPTR